MTLPLYAAPMNYLSNCLYRHIVLSHGADFAFSELMRMDRVDRELENQKLRLFEEDLLRTIFQIGVGTKEEVDDAVVTIKEHVGLPKEINLNMGCPHSSMKKKKICGGILFDQELMHELSSRLVDDCKGIIPSVKLRIGLDPQKIQIDEYLDVLHDAGIRKVYIHARSLRHPYARPATYGSLSEAKRQFPDMMLIFNGDIDSWHAYQDIVDDFLCDGVMIGRTAIQNPLIFQQIKNKEKTYKGPFNPEQKDTSLVHYDGFTYLSKEKAAVIIELVDLCEKEGLPLEYIKSNLKELLKGITDKILLRALNIDISFDDVKALLHKMSDSW
ncbi:hypothetical protein COT47_02455 [Candidatus Woesearchaeota archaeon CG08_land_8_20_14_0_20_43_7]|nr:MAG: hypothetical protein COT47_02455 [Candidatus Woesearchaeota archaeon CG08_land_8_20_14_0_20_43_7]